MTSFYLQCIICLKLRILAGKLTSTLNIYLFKDNLEKLARDAKYIQS